MLGKLDEPLGSLLTLRGNMVAEQPDRKGVDIERMFEVHQVGDRALSEPVMIDLTYRWNKEKAVAPRTRLQLVGYETGQFAGIAPAEYEWGKSAIRQDRGWHFAISFVVLQFDELPAGE